MLIIPINIGEFSFIKEDDNEHDPNAIAVYLTYEHLHELIGYIRRKNTVFIRNLLDREPSMDGISVVYYIMGGKWKMADNEEDADKLYITTGERNINISLEFYDNNSN